MADGFSRCQNSAEFENRRPRFAKPLVAFFAGDFSQRFARSRTRRRCRQAESSPAAKRKLRLAMAVVCGGGGGDLRCFILPKRKMNRLPLVIIILIGIAAPSAATLLLFFLASVGHFAARRIDEFAPCRRLFFLQVDGESFPPSAWRGKMVAGANRRRRM